MTETCSTCRFFVKHEAEHVYGDCHRFPATFNFHANISDPSEWRSTRFRIDVTRERNAVWPNIHEDEFCGEWASHQPKEGGHG